MYLCAVIVYIEDVQMFLNAYDHTNNTLACIARSFYSNDYLIVFCAVGALVGIHLIEPYLSITYYNKQKMIDISSPALKFVNQERFSICCKRPQEVLQKLKLCICANQTE